MDVDLEAVADGAVAAVAAAVVVTNSVGVSEDIDESDVDDAAIVRKSKRSRVLRSQGMLFCLRVFRM